MNQPTGYYQINLGSQGSDDIADEVFTALANGEHFPVATLIFRVTDPKPGEMIVLDEGNVLMDAHVACFNCGEMDVTKFRGPCTPPPDKM